MKDSKLLKNIYFSALHHRNSANLRMNNLLRDDIVRAKDEGEFDAYAWIVQMIENEDTIGIADYKRLFKMKEKYPR
jgi:hypothetical protein